MTTLTTAPLAPLLERLFAEADAATSPALDGFTADDRERLMRSKTEYLDLYGQLKDLWLPVSPETGRALYMLVRSTKATTIVEFGTSFGLSTLFLAAALRDNGGGRLIATEFEPGKIARAGQNVRDGGLDDLVDLRAGDALETLASDLPERIDLVLLDGAKALYSDVLDLLEPHLTPGALILADNADFCPDYLERVRSDTVHFVSTPFADDIELTLYLG